MVNFNSFTAYRRHMQKRKKRLKKTTDDAAAIGSFVFKNRLKVDAPKSSGRLAESTTRVKVRQGEYLVTIGYIPPGAPFNIARWANQEFAIVPQIPGGKASRWLKTEPGQSVRYGDANGVRWTAKKFPFHTLNLLKLREEFPRLNIQRVRKVWRT